MSDLRTDRSSRPVPSQPEPRMSSPKKTIAAVVALGAVAAFGVGIWFAYDQGVKRGASGAPPLVRAEQGPAKIAPENPGGMQVPNQDKQIYERIGGNPPPSGAGQTERLLPPPERPSATATAPNQSVTVPMRPTPNAVPNQAPSPQAAIPNRTDAPSAMPIPAAPGQPQPLTPPPAANPAPAPAQSAAAPAPKPAPAAAPAPSVTALPGGSAKVQLASLKDRAAAQSTWNQLQKKYGDLLGGLSPSYEDIEIPGKGSFVRLQAGPLKDRNAAQSVCEQLTAKKQGCIVVGR